MIPLYEKVSSGNVNDFGEEFGKNYLSWIQWNPINYPECRECNCLPICMGGCLDAMKNSSDNLFAVRLNSI
ncbi:MAG: SPASM domain-containing protein [Selenomonadaceae bacterium]|nr:SPASM domain-containing protein [Selenomonadaceae bacterium]